MQTFEFLDFVFPFFVLGYGGLVTFVLHFPPLVELAEKRLPRDLQQQLQGHRLLAIICLICGGLWSLQRVWTEPLNFIASL